MSGNYEVNKPSNSFANVYSVKKGETAYSIAKRNGLSLKTLQELNPTLDLNNIKVGQTLNLKGKKAQVQTNTDKKSVFTASNISKSQPKTPQKQDSGASLFSSGEVDSGPLIQLGNNKKVNPPAQQGVTTGAKNGGILTLEKFEQNMAAEAKLLKPFLKKKEGKVLNAYIAPDGKTTIGYGHLLVNKPKFLLDIEGKSLSVKEKNKLVKTALLKKENQEALKQSLQKDLADAIQKTGIKNVPSTVNKNLALTNEQIELLLNSDIKKAQNAMTKTFGKDVLSKRTTNQKLAVLDLFYNVGDLNSKAPEFVKQFKAGNMEKAQAELNIFKTNGNVSLGLIRRSYNRMLLLNDNKLSALSKERLLSAYNEYMKKHNKTLAKNFDSAESTLKKA